MALSTSALLGKLKRADNKTRSRIIPAYREVVEIVEKRYYPNGNIKTILYKRDGRLHRKGGPALQEFSPSGTLRSERWYRIGMIHREDGPAERIWSTDNGQLLSEVWKRYGQEHRRGDEPAVQKWFHDGSRETVEYRIRGKLHRDTDYAEFNYSRVEKDMVVLKVWWQHGINTRHDGYGYEYFYDGNSEIKEGGVGYMKNDVDITEEIVASGCTEPGTFEFKFTWDMISVHDKKVTQ